MWTKLDDAFYGNDKILSFTHQEFRLYVCALTRSAQHRTGGFVSPAAALALCRQQRVSPRAIAGLVEKRAWEPVEGGGWAIHDYDEYLPQGSHAKAEAGRKGGLHSGLSRRRARSTTEAEAKHAAQSTGSPVPVPVPVPLSAGGERAAPRSPSGAARSSDRPLQGREPDTAGPGDYVGHYVSICRRLGVEPVAQFRARIGREAKALAREGKSPELIAAAISRSAERNKQPNALPYLVAEIERERAGTLPPGGVASRAAQRVAYREGVLAQMWDESAARAAAPGAADDA